MKPNNCHCGNQIQFENCCQPFINKVLKPVTAEQLMRSRYSAYVIANADYLVDTTHLSTRKFHEKSDILNWAKSNKWQKLEVLESNENFVTFKAYYLNENSNPQVHYEKSRFIFENETWFYADGEFF